VCVCVYSIVMVAMETRLILFLALRRHPIKSPKTTTPCCLRAFNMVVVYACLSGGLGEIEE
jgi:hypothetical protein